jgi:DNA-binding NarL/FixJ family response regulator
MTVTAGIEDDRAATTRLRIVVVDRRSLVAEGLARIVAGGHGIDVASVVPEPSAAATIAAHRPDLVLIGVGPEPRPALTLAAGLAARLGGGAIVLIADALSPQLVTGVVDHSLGGLLLTDHLAGDLADTLRQIARGQTVLPAGWQAQLAPPALGPLHALSARQLEVLELLAEGCSYEEIGARLFISVNTVKFHMRSIFERLGVRNRMAAVRVLSQARG